MIREISNINESNSGNIYSTKEVGADIEDAWKINVGAIEGKYLFRIYKIGYIFAILKNKIFAVILISLILLYIYLTKIKQNQKHIKPKRIKSQ